MYFISNYLSNKMMDNKKMLISLFVMIVLCAGCLVGWKRDQLASGCVVEGHLRDTRSLAAEFGRLCLSTDDVC